MISAKDERRVSSQNGEDGVLSRMVEVFAPAFAQGGTVVEIGAGPMADECNAANLIRERGFASWLVDVDGLEPWVSRAFVTAENVDGVLDGLGAPREPTVLSIDVDGNDGWIFAATLRRPIIAVIEYNARLDPGARVPYDAIWKWDGSVRFGHSLLALSLVAQRKGYVLAYVESCGVNAFFVRLDAWVEALYRPYTWEPRA